MLQPTSTPAQIVAATIVPSVRLCGSGGFAPRFVCPVAVALVRYAARRTRKDRPAWLQRSVAPPVLGYAHRPVRAPCCSEEPEHMVVLGIDAHKRSHTVVAVDEHGRRLSTKTIGTTT